MMYGTLCTDFYNADKKFAEKDELAFYQTLFSKTDCILEPMCGSGRLLIPLLQLGYNIEGFDNSPSMLASCKQQARDLNLNPVVYQNTIEDFSSNKQYQGIMIPFGSFQLLYPRKKAYAALNQLKQLLLPGGKLVLDFFIPWEALCKNKKIDISTHEVQLSKDESIHMDNHTTTNKFEQHLASKITYTKYVKNKVILKEQEEMDVLWYYPHEIELMLEKHGFKQIQQTTRFLNGDDHLTFVAQV